MESCNNLNHEEALEIIIKIDTITSLNLANWASNWKRAGLSSLPEGIGKLANLQTLNLSRWDNLQTLPEGIIQTHILN